MMHDFPRSGQPYHPLGCACRACQPPMPGERGDRPELQKICLLVLAGIAVAFPIDWVIDRLADGPGVLALFGL